MSDGVERLVGTPVRVGDHGVDDDVVAVGIDAGGVGSEDHGQPIRRQAHTSKRPQIMVVRGAGADGDDSPAFRWVRLGPISRASGQGIIGVEAVGIYREHGATLSSCDSSLSVPSTTSVSRCEDRPAA